LIITFFEKNANYFGQKLSKIAENCNHNIDPWYADKQYFSCPGGVAKWSSRPPPDQMIPGFNPARVKVFRAL
jgi:hypothetical protein